MPSKRQPAKQRRAAENRAKRAALAARSERASQPRVTTARASSRASGTSGSSSSSRATAPTGWAAAGLGGGWAGWKEWLGFGPGAKRGPGVRAAFYAFILGLLAAVVAPLLPIVSVDDRGEQVPVAFRGLYLDARTRLAGEEVTAESTTWIDAAGPGVLLYLLLPLLVIIGVIVAFRRTGRSLPLTIGMMVLAVLVLMAGNIYFLPAMVAMAVSSFQVRRVEMAARAAEQAGSRGRDEDRPDDGAVEDTYDQDVDDAYDEDEVLDDEDVDDAYDENGYDEDNYVDDVSPGELEAEDLDVAAEDADLDERKPRGRRRG